MPGRPDQRSAEAEAYRALYKTKDWYRIRGRQLRDHPFCRMCADTGIVTPATVCDHVEPHRGDRVKFFGGPFQSLCKPHHDTTKRRQEMTGIVRGTDAEGRPLDPNHPWNRGAA